MKKLEEPMKCSGCGNDMEYLSPLFEFRSSIVIGNNYICRNCLNVKSKYF